MTRTGNDRAAPLRLALALGGTDAGQSGIGAYVHQILPRVIELVREHGGSIVAIGTDEELSVYRRGLYGAECHRVPTLFSKPGVSAAWYLTASGRCAAQLGANVFLLPAANRRLAAISSVPTVAVVHDLAQLHVEGKYDTLRMAYLRHVVIRSLRAARVLLAVSNATKSDLIEALDCDDSAIGVVSNGVDTDRFTPDHATEDDQLEVRALGVKTPYLLYVSRLEHPGKNHLRLLKGLTQSRFAAHHQIVLAGKDWGAGEMIRKLSAELGIERRVTILGFVDDEQLPRLIGCADAVIMVGLREGFGLPALEALAAGRPVIASNTGSLPEVCGELAAFCDPLDESSIARAIDEALAQPMVSAAAEQGPRWARRFGWDLTAQGLFDACLEARSR